ncbi:MAG: hypothetical protein KF789_02715 [Bdellovibrionaceae bacterium]|nr:hypothetical protein [Pseudobdellovibrionaceae bacterium]
MIDMNTMSYHILGRHNLIRDDLSLRNEAFTAWKEVWESVYNKSDSNYALKADEFERQDLITCIKIGERIAALHLYSFHHLESLACRSTHYFDFFTENYFKVLESNGVKTAMSMEFLTVHPDFRKSNVGFPLGSTLGQLGALIWQQANVDAIIAPARNDLKVNEAAYDQGFRCIEKETNQRGFICDLIALFRGEQKSSSDPLIRQATTTLWERKKIYASAAAYLPQTSPQVLQPRKAA